MGACKHDGAEDQSCTGPDKVRTVMLSKQCILATLEGGENKHCRQGRATLAMPSQLDAICSKTLRREAYKCTYLPIAICMVRAAPASSSASAPPLSSSSKRSVTLYSSKLLENPRVQSDRLLMIEFHYRRPELPKQSSLYTAAWM